MMELSDKRKTRYTDVNGKQIYTGDTVRVTGSIDFGVTSVDIDELCIVISTKSCEAIRKRDISLGRELYYEIDWFWLDESTDTTLNFEVVPPIKIASEVRE